MADKFKIDILEKIATLSAYEHGQTTKELRLIKYPAGIFWDLRIWNHFPDGTKQMTQRGITLNDKELARLKQVIAKIDVDPRSTLEEKVSGNTCNEQDDKEDGSE